MANPKQPWPRSLRWGMPIGIALVLAIAAAVFFGTRQLNQVIEQPAAPPAGGVGMTLDRIHQTATRDGRTEWSLDAQSAVYLQDEKVVMLKDLSVTFFMKDGQNVLLTAREGRVATDSNDMEAYGSVVVRNELYRMETERITYRHEPRLVESQTAVKISGQQGEITADGLSLDLNANLLTMTGHVLGILGGPHAP